MTPGIKSHTRSSPWLGVSFSFFFLVPDHSGGGSLVPAQYSTNFYIKAPAASAELSLEGPDSGAGGQLEGQCQGGGCWCCVGAIGVVPGWPEAV